MAYDPQIAEVASFTTVDDVATWAGLRDNDPAVQGDAGSTSRAQLYSALGLVGTDHYRQLAVVDEAAWTSLLAGWQPNGGAPSFQQRAAAAVLFIEPTIRFFSLNVFGSLFDLVGRVPQGPAVAVVVVHFNDVTDHAVVD